MDSISKRHVYSPLSVRSRLLNAIKNKYGELVSLQCENMALKYFNEDTRTLMVRCPAQQTKYFKSIFQEKCAFDETTIVIHIAGSIRKAHQAICFADRKDIRKAISKGIGK
ncbi:putative multi-domain containing protein [Aduncisulcus paluster]|uniref:Multi-domain containing protein n=1 Tax=Aduncisulcus paluster TaxID=2918883 RepID=A0ABQ5KI33_9EUKA|nr:putative multi-domain containing protein [Aduncisulcus paluster]